MRACMSANDPKRTVRGLVRNRLTALEMLEGKTSEGLSVSSPDPRTDHESYDIRF
jgi:hypothetical protein